MIWKEKLMAHVKPESLGIEMGPGRAALPEPGKNYDWIAAIRVVEYAPDLVGFLNGCAASLREGGLLYVVVSDRRYTGDHFRPLAGIGEVIDASRRRDAELSVGARVEALLSDVTKGGFATWQAGAPGGYAARFDFARAQEALAQPKDDSSVRRWCFTPISFLVLVSDLFGLGLTRFKIAGFYPTGGNDFHVALGLNHGKLIDGPERLKALLEVSKEQVQGDMPDFL